MKDILRELAAGLEADIKPRDVIAGFDGFIDEILHVVNKRSSVENYDRIGYMEYLAERINSAAGYSANIELVPQVVKIGGNGVILANALAECGMNIDYIGSLGAPDIDPVFLDFAHNCRSVLSLCQPGHTDALEFYDGKLMLGKIFSLKQVNWNNIIAQAGIDKIRRLTADADLIAFTNWTMLFEMNSIFNGFRDILLELDDQPFVFIDLADPAKRMHDDIIEATQLIRRFAQVSKPVLGMNEKESELIANCLGINENQIIQRAEAIRNHLDLFAAVIHPVKGAAAANAQDCKWVDGPYTSTPRLTTGAGDNFNAGFCLGLLLGFDLEKSLFCGVYTSGYYVRNAHSPSRAELVNYLKTCCTV